MATIVRVLFGQQLRLLEGTPSLGQLIIPALILAINIIFSFRVMQAQSEQLTESLSKIITFLSYGMDSCG